VVLPGPADYYNIQTPTIVAELKPGWAYQFNRDCPQDYWQIPFWWYQFEKDSAYQSNFRCRWKQVREGSLSDTRMYKLIDSVVALTAEARVRHFQRWPVLGQYIWPNPQPIPGSYTGEITALKEWWPHAPTGSVLPFLEALL
jgi:hypothetical protein